MKTKYLMIGLTVAICFSCNEEQYEPVPEACRQILLSAQISQPDAQTKGPINSNFTTDFSTGIYAIQGSWKAGATGNNINNDNATVSGSTGHMVNFSQNYNYPSDGSNLTFYAYTPYTSNIVLPGVNTSAVANITMTGQEDIMWATGTGNAAGGVISNPTLNYTHKLTQINFVFKSGTGYSNGNEYVTSLLLKSQPNQAAMTVETGSCTFSGSADMQLLTAAQIAAGGIAITTAGTNAGALLTKPATTTFSIQITVKQLSGDIVTYTKSTSLTAQEGYAHTMTLTFNKTGLTVSAKVGTRGSGSGLTITQ